MTWKSNTRRCMVEGCDDFASSLDLCPACYQRMRYWQHRPMKDKVRRIKQIHRCESTMNMQLGNVRTIRGAIKRVRQA